MLTQIQIYHNIEKWDGKLPETIVTDNPNTFLNLPSK